MLFQTRTHFSKYRLALGLLLVGFSGWSAHAQQANGDGFSAKSDVAGIEFITLDHLPKAPASASSQEECTTLVITPKTTSGQAVAALGWGVTAELPLGPYQAVSFAGQFDPATSGTCEVDKGNVAIFQDQKLIALAYAGKGSKQTIGTISALQDGLRVWDGGLVGSPVADLHVRDGHLLQITAIAAEDLVCAGQGKVPNVYGKPIDKARQALGSSGWEPLKNPKDLAADEVQYGQELALSRRGIVEVDSCSGTGFNFCGFYYRKGDMELSVTTVGEGDFPAVVDYHAACDQTHWHQPD
ncbi:hypothetical protein [Mesorhizobium sp. B2-3-4]|uniref:hypothetical protein n=1 Tax=Mesorhizobium sp. B2-3-4 TaxID=2589959 RepID=UPI0011288000|nr:hypothetical protein [Mesorhizobium sp. B2-3-4]TPM37206.1 hypothetical protein FJ967_17135 [Mesorhizobium sp. B2-3-4]